MIATFKNSSSTALVGLLLLGAGCGPEADATGASAGDGERPSIAVTTNILGDVVGELVGDQADVITIMPVGADPHSFQASAQEVDLLLSADALITNGGNFEEGLLDVIDSALDADVAIYEAVEAVDTISFVEDGHRHDEEEHGHGEESEHDEEPEHDEDADHNEEHGHDGADPHFFTDPIRMSEAVRGIADFLNAEVSRLDEAALDAATDRYVGELEALDAEVTEMVAAIAEERRILVTNHEVFGYFADRYGFEVVGAVIPGGTTVESASARDIARLAELIEAEGVPAIFADTSSSDDLAETLASEVGDIDVVELFSESLGEPGSEGDTYLEMVRTNASRISAALR